MRSLVGLRHQVGFWHPIGDHAQCPLSELHHSMRARSELGVTWCHHHSSEVVAAGIPTHDFGMTPWALPR